MLTLILRSPNRVLTYTDLESIKLFTQDGPVLLLPKHSHMIFALKSGIVETQPFKESMSIVGGFGEIKDNICTITEYKHLSVSHEK